MLAIGMLIPAVVLAGVPVPPVGTVQIDVGNIVGGVEGGNNNFCSKNEDGSPNLKSGISGISSLLH